MDTHGIVISVISLANPWLDFLPPETAASTARELNDSLDAMCGEYPGRLFSFGALPLSASIGEIVDEVKRLATLKYMRGVVMGTSGLGSGLDDERLDAIYKALQETSQVVFLHPHYGLPNEVFGPRASESGHVLPLALGYAQSPSPRVLAGAKLMCPGQVPARDHYRRFQNDPLRRLG